MAQDKLACGGRLPPTPTHLHVSWLLVLAMRLWLRTHWALYIVTFFSTSGFEAAGSRRESCGVRGQRGTGNV